MSAAQDDALLVLMTFPDEAVARTLARRLVEQRLVACVNLVPQVRSIYRWDGAICEDAEVLALAKTTKAVLPALTRAVEAQHPYDVPEVLAFPVTGGLPAYLAWVASHVDADAQP